MTYHLITNGLGHSRASFLAILVGLVIYRFAQVPPASPCTTRVHFTMNRIGFFASLVASLMLATSVRAQNSEIASANDAARFLAGMELSPDSPLAQIAQDPNIKQQASYFDIAFDKVEKNQLSKIRVWSAANLTAPKPVMIYMFGGPDFLYANAFFPNAMTYVLGGLEPVGQIPDITKMPRWSIVQALRNIQGSLRNILTVSYFITAHMSQDLNAGPVNGTLPILYVFLARSGKVIHDVSLVHLDEQGMLQQGDGSRPRSPARGVKIIFSENDGPQKTLYYFSTNLADERGKDIALLKFIKSLGQGDSFVKSASYLMHQSYFSQVRNFLLDNSSVILQDDSGVPVRLFDATKWQLRPFGQYVGPISIFQEMHQSKLDELYQRNRPSPIEFGVGYQWYPNQSNLLLAIRKPSAPDTTASVSKDAAPRKAESDPPADTRMLIYRDSPASRPNDDDDSYQRRVYRAPSPSRPSDEYQPYPRQYQPYQRRAYRPPPPPDVPFPFFPFLFFLPP